MNKGNRQRTGSRFIEEKFEIQKLRNLISHFMFKQTVEILFLNFGMTNYRSKKVFI